MPRASQTPVLREARPSRPTTDSCWPCRSRLQSSNRSTLRGAEQQQDAWSAKAEHVQRAAR
eukprot:16023308-Heterocapsa_arctica.AAC.1